VKYSVSLSTYFQGPSCYHIWLLHNFAYVYPHDSSVNEAFTREGANMQRSYKWDVKRNSAKSQGTVKNPVPCTKLTFVFRNNILYCWRLCLCPAFSCVALYLFQQHYPIPLLGEWALFRLPPLIQMK